MVTATQHQIVAIPNRTNGQNSRNRLCYNCNQGDHLIASCPFLQGEVVGDDGNDTVPKVRGINDTRMSDVNYLTITVNGCSEPCLVDTGSQVSLVPTRLAAACNLQTAPTRLEAANNTPINVVGKFVTGILLNGHCTTAEFFVSPDIDEEMIGMDFLSAHACEWDFKTHTLSLDGRRLKLFRQKNELRCRRVLVTGTVTLPPFSQTIFPATAPYKNLNQMHSDSMLESHQLSPTLTVARTLVPSYSSRISTCVLNTSDKQETLTEGACLGYLETVEVCPGNFPAKNAMVRPAQTDGANAGTQRSSPISAPTVSAEREVVVSPIIENLVQNLPADLTV